MLNRSLSAACWAGAEEAGVRDAVDERVGRTAGAGVVANVWTGAAAWAVEPENTCWPEEDVTVPLRAGAVVCAAERLGAAVVRSAEAGAWLRATLGVRNVGAGAV